jgi:hypothetical protein
MWENELQSPGVDADVRLYDPRPGFQPIPAICFDMSLCEHKGQCPIIYVRQEFLLEPDKFSPYWSVTQDEAGNFIVKSDHRFGEENENNERPSRTFIWRVTDKFDTDQNCWIAMWVD